MNPYLNSLNSWGGGFIAFWPSTGVVVEDVAGGFPGRRYLLPNGRVYPDPREAYLALETYLRAVARSLDSGPKKKSKSRSIHAKPERVRLETLPMPQLVSALKHKVPLAPEFIALVEQTADEEALLVLLLD